MNPLLTRVALVIATALPLPAFAQLAPGQRWLLGHPTTQPRAEDFVLKEFHVEHATVEEALEQLHKAIPGFQAVVFRDVGVPPGEPRLTFTVRDTGYGAILTLMQIACPAILVSHVDNPGGEDQVIAVKIGRADGVTRTSAPAVKVYRLASIVKNQMLLSQKNWALTLSEGSTKEYDVAMREALDQTLSLVQATIEQIGGTDPAPQFKVHAPTLTLIFKGTAEQRAAVDNAIEALQASDAELKASSAQFFARNQKDVEELREKLQDARNDVDALKSDLKRLRATTRPGPGGTSGWEGGNSAYERLLQKRREELGK